MPWRATWSGWRDVDSSEKQHSVAIACLCGRSPFFQALRHKIQTLEQAVLVQEEATMVTDVDRCWPMKLELWGVSGMVMGLFESVGEAIVATQSDIEELQKGVTEQQP